MDELIKFRTLRWNLQYRKGFYIKLMRETLEMISITIKSQKSWIPINFMSNFTVELFKHFPFPHFFHHKENSKIFQLKTHNTKRKKHKNPHSFILYNFLLDFKLKWKWKLKKIKRKMENFLWIIKRKEMCVSIFQNLIKNKI